MPIILPNLPGRLRTFVSFKPLFYNRHFVKFASDFGWVRSNSLCGLAFELRRVPPLPKFIFLPFPPNFFRELARLPLPHNNILLHSFLRYSVRRLACAYSKCRYDVPSDAVQSQPCAPSYSYPRIVPGSLHSSTTASSCANPPVLRYVPCFIEQ
jgi:hypothetical protein